MGARERWSRCVIRHCFAHLTITDIERIDSDTYLGLGDFTALLPRPPRPPHGNLPPCRTHARYLFPPPAGQPLPTFSPANSEPTAWAREIPGPPNRKQAMTSDAGKTHPISSIRSYLLQESNSALRRPGWFGGKITLRLYFEAMVFVDGCEQLGSSPTRTRARRLAGQ